VKKNFVFCTEKAVFYLFRGRLTSSTLPGPQPFPRSYKTTSWRCTVCKKKSSGARIKITRRTCAAGKKVYLTARGTNSGRCGRSVYVCTVRKPFSIACEIIRRIKTISRVDEIRPERRVCCWRWTRRGRYSYGLINS
jgi:hypothetical protein